MQDDARQAIQEVTATPPTVLAMVSQAISSASVDVEKMERVFALMERQQAREAEAFYNQAMAEAQAEMTPVVKSRKSDKGRYASLDDINQTVVPILGKHGLSVSFSCPPPHNPDNVAVACRISHAAGHSRDFPQIEAPPDATGLKGAANKTAVQAVGSTITYLQRYALRLALNVVLDDDGDTANSAPTAVRRISPETAKEIFDGFSKLGTLDAMLKHYGVPTVEDIPATLASEIISAMNIKLRKRAEAEAQASQQPQAPPDDDNGGLP